MLTIHKLALVILLFSGCPPFTVNETALHTQPVQTGTTPQTPAITGVLWTGRDLVIIGDGFDLGAKVFVNGTKQKTLNDPEHPTTSLIARKAGKKLVSGASITVQVKNPDGEFSEAYSTLIERTVTLADNGTTIYLHVGDRLFVYLGSDYLWTLQAFDTNILRAVPGVGTLIRGAQALLQTEQPGQTDLILIGDPPCRQSQPPCSAPSLQFRITVVVQ